MKKHPTLRGLIAATLALSISGGCLATERLTITVENLEGSNADFNNGNIKKGISQFSSALTIIVQENSASLNTGVTTLRKASFHQVGQQLTFVFDAELAVWTVSCYPSIGVAFVNVHSDASQYGGARMLSYSGTCRTKES